MASSFLDVCRFNPTAGGTADWTYSSAVQGYQGLSAAGAVNGATYSYRAESADLSQWEVGTGVYSSGTGVLTRAAVLFNSSGTTSKINFSTVPQVAVVALAEDLPTLPVSVANGGTGNTGGAWTAWAPTPTPSGGGSFTSVTATGSYLQIGKMVYFIVSVTVTNIGTGSGKVTLPLPIGTAKRSFVASGAEIGAIGVAVTYTVSGGGSGGTIQAHDNATNVMVNGYLLNLTGFYEAS